MSRCLLTYKIYVLFLVIMTLQQIKDMQILLALYWKKKAQKKRINKELEEMIVLLAQMSISDFHQIVENMSDDAL